MSAGILLIDGYNLLHAAGMGQRDYRPGDLLRCRTRLLKFLLGNLSPAEVRGTTVVFDARDPPPDRPAQFVVSGVRVLFANPGGDADSLIKNWLSHCPSPRQVTLVSSDRELQRAARSSSAKFVGSEEFVEMLNRREGRSVASRSASWADTNSPSRRHASAQEIAYWLKVFGDVPVVEPDADDQQLAPPPGVIVSKSKPAFAARRSRRSRNPRARDDSKSGGIVAGEELAYWMKVFGESPAETSAASPDVLRLSDLEDWLKAFEANEQSGTIHVSPARKRGTGKN